jgi:hypothetical protein
MAHFFCRHERIYLFPCSNINVRYVEAVLKFTEH